MRATADISKRPNSDDLKSSKLGRFAPPPHSKENNMTPHEALLLLAAVISNFTWLYTIKQRWFND